MSVLLPSRLYAVADADVCAAAGWTLPDFAAACFDGGVTFIQLRAKALASRDFLAAVDAVVARAAAAAATVVVNDRADIARLAGAGGVHVGQDDLSPAQVRTVAGGSLLVGLSTHTWPQLDAALHLPVDYVAIGPVFDTPTKDTGYTAVGLDGVRTAAGIAGGQGRPLVAIGGITLERASAVIAAGAAAVAVIGDLMNGNDPARRTRAYLDRLARV